MGGRKNREDSEKKIEREPEKERKIRESNAKQRKFLKKKKN